MVDGRRYFLGKRQQFDSGCVHGPIKYISNGKAMLITNYSTHFWVVERCGPLGILTHILQLDS